MNSKFYRLLMNVTLFGQFMPLVCSGCPKMWNIILVLCTRLFLYMKSHHKVLSSIFWTIFQLTPSLAILAAIHVLAIMAITAILRKWPLWHKLLSPGIKPNLASKMYILKCLKGDLNIKHFKWQYAIFETCLQIIWGPTKWFLICSEWSDKKVFFPTKKLPVNKLPLPLACQEKFNSLSFTPAICLWLCIHMKSHQKKFQDL